MSACRLRCRGAIKTALAEVIFQLQRVTEADAVTVGNLPVEALSGQEIMQRRFGENPVDGFLFCVADADQISACLLTVFHSR